MYFVTASSEVIVLQPFSSPVGDAPRTRRFAVFMPVGLYGHPTAGATHLGNPIKSPVRSAGDFLLTSSGLRGCHWRGMTSQF